MHARTAKILSGLSRVQRENSAVVVEPLDETDGSLPDIQILRSYSVLRNGVVDICVANFYNEDVILYPKHIIAKLCFADLDISLDKEDSDIEHKVVIKSASAQKVDEIIKMLDVGPLADDQKCKFEEFISKYSNVFSIDDMDLGDVVPHEIPIEDEVPIRLAHRRIPPHMQREVKDHLNKWLCQGIIKPSTSPYASQIVLVRKKDNSFRICIDFRALNTKTRKDAYPLPRIEGALDCLKGSKYFTSLDLSQGYLQCALSEKDAHKTAFRAGSGGLYQFTRMPFGLCNAAATFSRLMGHCFGDMNLESLLIYLDDILLFANTFDGMLQRLEVVFEQLMQFNLKLKPSKCHFFRKQVLYLGHIVSEDGVKTDSDKTMAVDEWNTPQTERDLRSFLGLSGFYRKFVPGYAKIAVPYYTGY